MYFSVDMECDGESPTTSSMLSVGAVALGTEDLEEVGSFTINLFRQDGATPSNQTMSWWDRHPEAYIATRKNLVDVEHGMKTFSKWVHDTVRDAARAAKAAGKYGPNDGLEAQFVAYPAGFDFMWVAGYLHKYVGHCEFGFAPLDMASLAAGLLMKPGSNLAKLGHKSSWPTAWTDGLPDIPHIALEDARIQAEIFRRMIRHGTTGSATYIARAPNTETR